MHLHILGIAGTFMSGLAILAKEAGYKVTGCDAQCYPPVSDLLMEKGIPFEEGYDSAKTALKADLIIVGNAVKRGMPVMEAVLNAHKPYISGPQWLAEHILSRYKVIAVAGTHGKTTTTAMLTHILNEAGLKPGFLIGGVAPGLKTSARLSVGDWFVIEADEYDTAYFDKRPKLMHYKPWVTVINNLEYDHADIYPNIKAIEQQFHYYLRMIPQEGTVIVPRDDNTLKNVIARGTYSQLEKIAIGGQGNWVANILNQEGSHFEVLHEGSSVGEVKWSLIGGFNVENALAAIAASYKTGIHPKEALKALETYTPIKRRLEVKVDQDGVVVYDDFAHHPTAIRKTLEALKASARHKRIFVVMEFASYTMRTGVHEDEIGQALASCDKAFILKPEAFDLSEKAKKWPFKATFLNHVPDIVDAVMSEIKPNDAILVMSNKGFGHIHDMFKARLEARAEA